MITFITPSLIQIVFKEAVNYMRNFYDISKYIKIFKIGNRKKLNLIKIEQ